MTTAAFENLAIDYRTDVQPVPFKRVAELAQNPASAAVEEVLRLSRDVLEVRKAHAFGRTTFRYVPLPGESADKAFGQPSAVLEDWRVMQIWQMAEDGPPVTFSEVQQMAQEAAYYRSRLLTSNQIPVMSRSPRVIL